ncbi:tRNA preQ1(34) S-adenosylmethionine ribosyltransferase-isomerase QueA [Venenivibrio stagnispumantis]|uniref:S-adenosylmethionine:tRNA ribosyltransferase-isomerase n=1 Tax=Venenivibrio stagnispumantis TaxID=407998 RepID=A0AA45WMY3_9AQUI|nr:tRNA preQ1(34) S-adenosylmethionine ribosyltransferase-isomerase QueA [Venenivibrio stagnispumantis]MCW4573753.1 tRNA preQ1(34) S-adenosylmethionine ribosyltransferase-isomerase QueA [Venenivibrio stagnispumantis]SMP15679.1 S-adenosylmethionine--tRNA ribosyltransferase-isomerase [Venenivibrio stagnispumantis]
MNRLSEYNFELPQELIAKYPVEPRDHCRLMVLHRENQKIEHKIFYQIIDYINEGDLLIFNDTKVIPARLIGTKETGAKIEIFLLRPLKEDVWEALIKNVRRLKIGSKVYISQDFFIELIERKEETAIIKLNTEDIKKAIKKYGHIPLPPYIDREDEEKDKQMYQTVFASKEGAVAAPTAGLHFTEELISKLKQKGVKIGFITLHVGIGTFKPITTEDITKHKMHEEFYQIPEETIKLIKETKENNKNIFAVGTTVVRTLESYANTGKTQDYTNIFIYPPYKFKLVDKLITNFHLPKSTLLLLVSAFAGKDFILKAYNEAIKEKYRFFSYGDAMLIL